MKLACGKIENGSILPHANSDLRVIDSECQGKREPGNRRQAPRSGKSRDNSIQPLVAAGISHPLGISLYLVFATPKTAHNTGWTLP
jgi:hypothetical protein